MSPFHSWAHGFRSFAINALNPATISASTLSLTGNSQTATATANEAINALTLGGITSASIAAGSALMSSQTGNGTVSSLTNLELFTPIGVSAKSGVLITGNINTAQSQQNDVTNAVSVTATNVAAVLAAGTEKDQSTFAQADSVLGSQQTSQGVVSSSAVTSLFNNENASGSAAASVANSTVKVSGNATSATSSANTANNNLTLAGSANEAAAAALFNNQLSNSLVTASATTGATLKLGATGSATAVDTSQITLTGNTTIALAEGNFATNTVAVTGTNVSSISGSTGPVNYSGVYAADALLNVQTSHANLNSSATSNLEVDVATGTGKSLLTSGLTIDANVTKASAIANSATNSLSVIGGASQAAAAGLLNIQSANAAVQATATSAATAALSNATLDHSTVFLNGGTTTALAEANIATNTVVSSGTNESSVYSTFPLGNQFADVSLQSANSLANSQTSSSAVTSTAQSTLNTGLTNGSGQNALLDSGLTANANLTKAQAVANTAVNSLSMSGSATNAATAGLVNNQTDVGPVVATAKVSATPGLSGGTNGVATLNSSTTSVNGNSTMALAEGNVASNTVVVTGVNLTGIPVTNLVPGLTIAYDFLDNKQVASGGVTSNATSSLVTSVANSSTADSLHNSASSTIGNNTTANAFANYATNSLSVVGGAVSSDGAGLSNFQTSNGPVLATATTTANTFLNVSANNSSNSFNGSTVSVDNNSTQAVAAGNVATNAVVATAGASAVSVVNSVSSGAWSSASATVAVLNSQQNLGSVSAGINGGTTQVVLNGGATNGAVSASFNTNSAVAYGNYGSNSITLNPLNSGTPTAALASNQSNSGNVTATVSNVYYGSGITGGASNTAIRVSGNQITATAVGNSATSSILASR